MSLFTNGSSRTRWKKLVIYSPSGRGGLLLVVKASIVCSRTSSTRLLRTRLLLAYIVGYSLTIVLLHSRLSLSTAAVAYQVDSTAVDSRLRVHQLVMYRYHNHTCVRFRINVRVSYVYRTSSYSSVRVDWEIMKKKKRWENTPSLSTGQRRGKRATTPSTTQQQQ